MEDVSTAVVSPDETWGKLFDSIPKERLDTSIPLTTDGVLRTENLMMLAGAPGSMKSLTLLDGANSGKFFGKHEALPGMKTLWVEGENRRQIDYMRDKLGCRSNGHIDYFYPAEMAERLGKPDIRFLSSESGWKVFERFIDHVQPNHIVFDPLFALVDFDISKSLTQCTNFLAKLQGLARSKKALITIINHTVKAKADVNYGSAAWEALLDTLIIVEKSGKDAATKSCTLVAKKTRTELSHAWTDLAVTSTLNASGGYDMAYKAMEQAETKPVTKPKAVKAGIKREERAAYIMKRRAEGATVRDICVELGCSGPTYYDALKMKTKVAKAAPAEVLAAEEVKPVDFLELCRRDLGLLPEPKKDVASVPVIVPVQAIKPANFGKKEDWFKGSWNPITGCTKYSDGCNNCYAERNCLGLITSSQPKTREKYKNGFTLTLHPELLAKDPPVSKGSIFCCSMSDLFHAEVPDQYIKDVFAYMQRQEKRHWHILTKRSDRLASLASQLPWPRNIWAGVTVEDAKYIHRANQLRSVPAALRFLYCEPLLGSLKDLDLTGIQTVVAAGESGIHARETKAEWVQELRDKCQQAGVIFFFKQWGDNDASGGANRISENKRGGCLIDGREHKDRPALS
jgi:protein gp37